MHLLFTLALLFLAMLPLLLVFADDMVQCSDYSDPIEGDDVFWSDEVLKLDHFPPLTTIYPYQVDTLQGNLSIKHSRSE